MDNNNPNVNVGFLVYDVARLMRENFNQKVQTLGMTLAQARVLAHLSRNEGISQVALSAILDVQPITLLRQIDRLEKAGLLRRQVHPNDRRMQQLYLTSQAQPLLDKIFAADNDAQVQLLAGIDAAAFDQLIAALTKIRANLSQLPAHVDVALSSAVSISRAEASDV